MQLDLSGRGRTQEPIRVRLYADEIQKQENAAGERWMYIGILAIPKRGYGHALSMLAKDREKAYYAREVHFIQLCDVLMVGLTQCLDARNTKAGCCEIAEMLLPLAERLTDPKRVNNPNSRYRYVQRLSMSFFPSRKLKLKELEDVYKRGRSGFYINRHLLFKDQQRVDVMVRWLR